MQNVQTKSWSNCALADLPSVATQLLSYFPKPCFFAIEGEMGAGKTTFVQALLRELGIEKPDGSPTYAIVNEYRSNLGMPIYHLDCYRIENERDLAQLGLDELFDQAAFFFVEWPKKIENILPDDAKWLYIRCAPDSELREIVLTYDN